MDPAPFDGSGDSDASAWLKAFEERSKKKSPSWKMKRFEKLVEGQARNWWYTLRNADHWDTLRETFVAYWVNGLRGEEYQKECREIVLKAPKSTISINLVTTEPIPPPPSPLKPEPSNSHPLFSVLVSTCTLDPHGIYKKAYAEFLRADDKEKMFRVLWDAAYAAGRQSGMLAGRSEVRVESIEEGRQLGMAIAKNEAEMRKIGVSVAVDTSGLETHCKFTPTVAQTLPSAPSCSVSLGMDTETLTVPQTDSNVNSTELHTKLDWAEEATSIPDITLFPAPAPLARNFTVLRCRSSSTQPFHSLHQRTQRIHRRQRNIPLSTLATTGTTNNPVSHPIITHSHPAGLGPGRPMHTLYCHPSHSAHRYKPLDWSGDPRLVELGRILVDLGWVRR